MKQLFFLLLLMLGIATSCSAQLPRSIKDAAGKVTAKPGGLTNDEVIAGLK
jgi:hypothetical protein